MRYRCSAPPYARLPLIAAFMLVVWMPSFAAAQQPPEGNPCQGEDVVDTNPNGFVVESDQIGRLNIAEVYLSVVKGTPDASVTIEADQTIRVPVGKLTKTAYPNCWSGPFTPKAELVADGKTLYSVFFRLVDANGLISPVKPGKGSPFVLGTAAPDPVPEPLRAPNGRVGRTGG